MKRPQWRRTIVVALIGGVITSCGGDSQATSTEPESSSSDATSTAFPACDAELAATILTIAGSPDPASALRDHAFVNGVNSARYRQISSGYRQFYSDAYLNGIATAEAHLRQWTLAMCIKPDAEPIGVPWPVDAPVVSTAENGDRTDLDLAATFVAAWAAGDTIGARAIAESPAIESWSTIETPGADSEVTCGEASSGQCYVRLPDSPPGTGRLAVIQIATIGEERRVIGVGIAAGE